MVSGLITNQNVNFYNKHIKPRMHKPLVGVPVVWLALFSGEKFILGELRNIKLESISYKPFFIVIIANFIIAIAVWYFSFRRAKKFRSDEIGIIIALTKLDDSVNEELNKLYKNIQSIIHTENFKTSKLIVRLVPDYLIPEKEDQAHKLRKKFNAKLIVWGNVDCGENMSNPGVIFTPIFFSYQLHLPPDRAVVITQGFNHVLANRLWIINENNNILDRGYLARNIEEVSLYIIGAVLFFANRSEESFEVFKKVLSKYETKPQLTLDDIIAIENIKILIFKLFNEEIDKLNLGPRGKTKDKDVKIAEKLICEMRGVGFLTQALLLEGQVKFTKGLINQAINKILEAYRLSPNEPVTCFSLAFLYFYKEDLLDGWIWLKRAKNKGAKVKSILKLPEIAAWYEDALFVEPRKNWLHFPLGVIYFEYLKEFKHSQDSLRLFLQKYSSKGRELRPLVVESEKILKKIKKQKHYISWLGYKNIHSSGSVL